MPRASEIRTNFSAGELSRLVSSRRDYANYYNGSELVENFEILVQGALFRRKGFRFIAETKDSTKKSRIIKFEFNVNQTYSLEFGENYIRFYTNQGQILSGGSPYEISTPYLEEDLLQVKAHSQDKDVIYITHPKYPVQKLTRLTPSTFSLSEVELFKGPYINENIISTDLATLTGGSWTEGSGLTLTASGGHTPFTSDHIGGLWRVRTGTDYAHLKITGFTSSTVIAVQAKNDIPTSLRSVAKFTWSEGEFSDARGYPNAIAFHEQRMILAGTTNEPNRVWFSESNGDYENFEAGTESNDSFRVKLAVLKGDPIKWLFSDSVLFIGTTGGIFRAVSSKNSGALAPNDIDVKKHISFSAKDIQPELVGNSVVYIQSGSNKVRNINYSLKSDKYESIDLTTANPEIVGDGIKEVSYQQNPISRLLLIRADGQLVQLTSEESEQILSWSRYTTQGLFESITTLSTNGNDELYCIVKRTINGVTKRFVEIQQPDYLVDNLNRFFVDSGLTYNGTGTTSLTLDSGSAFLEEININSDTATFMVDDVGKEIHELNTGTGRALITAFVDSENVTVTILELFSNESITSWAIAIKEISGLNHLIGEVVSICSDGATETNQVVNSSGNITVTRAGSIIHVGLPYTTKQKNMPLEATALQSILGSTQHKIQKIDGVVISFVDTLGGTIRTNDGDIPIIARTFNDKTNQAPDLFEGDEEVTLGADWDNKGQIEVIQDEPQPMTLKSITYKTTVNDK